MMKYQVVPFYTGCVAGTMNENKLSQTLNKQAASGWRFVRSIHETRRIAGIFSRETHFLIFERGDSELPKG